jgi:hypothetical protein
MTHELIQALEAFLHQEDFGTNWDGAYQDVIPTIRRYFDANGFQTRFLNEFESPSRDTELVASKERITVRIPWAEDRNGRSVVHLHTIQIAQSVSESL